MSEDVDRGVKMWYYKDAYLRYLSIIWFVIIKSRFLSSAWFLDKNAIEYMVISKVRLFCCATSEMAVNFRRAPVHPKIFNHG